MLLINTPIVAYLKIKYCLFYLYVMCICNVYLCSFFNNKDKIMTIFIFTHFGLNIRHHFLYFVTSVRLCLYNSEMCLAVLLKQLAK